MFFFSRIIKKWDHRIYKVKNLYTMTRRRMVAEDREEVKRGTVQGPIW